MPLEEAKQRALALIRDSSRFETVTEGHTNNPAIERLGPILQDFFANFETVREINGDFLVGRKAVANSSLRLGFLKFGSDFASSELV